VGSYVYNDVSLTWSRDRYTVRPGVNNLFDKQPPVLPQFTQFGNTGASTITEAYDTVGAACSLRFNYNTE